MSEDLIGLAALMLIFGIVLILVGIYIFTGHKNQVLFWRTDVKDITLDTL